MIKIDLINSGDIKVKEIGSEFWSVDKGDTNNSLDYLKINGDYRLVMSGRTAIDYVLKEISDDKKVVYMPNYCCQSMVTPFLDNGYKIVYYSCDVINNKYFVDINTDCSVFFAMSYFGYSSSNMDNYISLFRKRKIVVIEDITHRLLCDINYCPKSTYLVASLRKWFPIISGGIAVSVNGMFKNNLETYNVNQEFVSVKTKAMNLKKEYILGNFNNKNEFLKLYSISNHLIEDYWNKAIDNESKDFLIHLDIGKIKKTRINNCKVIERLLKNNKKIKLLYKYRNGDCPLFVPIILNDRDEIRKKLIEDKIYLPVHWPNDNSENIIYDLELSLINDQRYNEYNIEKYVNKLIEIVGE